MVFPAELGEAARSRHVEACLDERSGNGDLFFCVICQEDLSALNDHQRQLHINRCCDNSADVGRRAEDNHQAGASSDSASAGTAPGDGQLPDQCPLCQHSLDKFAKPAARASHIKRCARERSIDTADLLKLMKGGESLTVPSCLPEPWAVPGDSAAVAPSRRSPRQPKQQQQRLVVSSVAGSSADTANGKPSTQPRPGRVLRLHDFAKGPPTASLPTAVASPARPPSPALASQVSSTPNASSSQNDDFKDNSQLESIKRRAKQVTARKNQKSLRKQRKADACDEELSIALALSASTATPGAGSMKKPRRMSRKERILRSEVPPLVLADQAAVLARISLCVDQVLAEAASTTPGRPDQHRAEQETGSDEPADVRVQRGCRVWELAAGVEPRNSAAYRSPGVFTSSLATELEGTLEIETVHDSLLGEPLGVLAQESMRSPEQTRTARSPNQAPQNEGQQEHDSAADVVVLGAEARAESNALIVASLASLVNDRTHADLEFVVGGQCLYAHRALLVARHPESRLAPVCAGAAAGTASRHLIPVAGISAHLLGEVLRHCYTGQCNLASAAQAAELAHAAASLKHHDLATLCTAYCADAGVAPLPKPLGPVEVDICLSCVGASPAAAGRSSGNGKEAKSTAASAGAGSAAARSSDANDADSDSDSDDELYSLFGSIARRRDVTARAQREAAERAPAAAEANTAVEVVVDGVANDVDQINAVCGSPSVADAGGRADGVELCASGQMAREGAAADAAADCGGSSSGGDDEPNNPGPSDEEEARVGWSSPPPLAAASSAPPAPAPAPAAAPQVVVLLSSPSEAGETRSPTRPAVREGASSAVFDLETEDSSESSDSDEGGEDRSHGLADDFDESWQSSQVPMRAAEEMQSRPGSSLARAAASADDLAQKLHSCGAAAAAPTIDAALPVAEQVTAFLRTQADLYLALLHYDPLDLSEVQKRLKEAGVRIDIKSLMRVLDQEGVAFHTAASSGRKRARAAKTVSSKRQRASASASSAGPPG